MKKNSSLNYVEDGNNPDDLNEPVEQTKTDLSSSLSGQELLIPYKNAPARRPFRTGLFRSKSSSVHVSFLNENNAAWLEAMNKSARRKRLKSRVKQQDARPGSLDLLFEDEIDHAYLDDKGQKKNTAVVSKIVRVALFFAAVFILAAVYFVWGLISGANSPSTSSVTSTALQSSTTLTRLATTATATSSSSTSATVTTTTTTLITTSTGADRTEEEHYYGTFTTSENTVPEGTTSSQEPTGSTTESTTSETGSSSETTVPGTPASSASGTATGTTTATSATTTAATTTEATTTTVATTSQEGTTSQSTTEAVTPTATTISP